MATTMGISEVCQDILIWDSTNQEHTHHMRERENQRMQDTDFLHHCANDDGLGGYRKELRYKILKFIFTCQLFEHLISLI